MKKVLTYTLILGFVVFGANPLSLCAMVSSTVSDCVSPETRPQCDQMGMGEHPVSTVTSRSIACCAVSQAPLPESKTEASKNTVKLESAAALTSATDAAKPEHVRIPSVPQELSPPPLRSLLCTFLI